MKFFDQSLVDPEMIFNRDRVPDLNFLSRVWLIRLSGRRYCLGELSERVYVGGDDRFSPFWINVDGTDRDFKFSSRVWLICERISIRGGGVD